MSAQIIKKSVEWNKSAVKLASLKVVSAEKILMCVIILNTGFVCIGYYLILFCGKNVSNGRNFT